MNIFEIEKELLDITNELEENGGELTPELEEKMKITQDTFKTKVQGYTNVIKQLKSDIKLVDDEINRLTQIADQKSKTIERLTNILVTAINEFGELNKNNVKFVDYGTGKVSVRKTKAVEVNEELVKGTAEDLQNTITYLKETNQIDVVNGISMNVNPELKHELDDIKASFTVDIPIKDIDTFNGFNAIRAIALYTDTYKLKTSVSKTELKAKLEENGSAYPNLARLKTNESLIIK